MRNMLYYLKKFGNKSFDELPFSEIDALVLSTVTYMNVDFYSTDFNEEIFVKDIVNEENAKKLSYATMCRPGNVKFCKVFPNTTRYDNVYMKHIINKLKYEGNVEQFCAVTFFIDDLMLVSFRGTDLTIAGWQEDFNMAFAETVPSQVDSVMYLNNIYDLYKHDLMICGHSKGGNLALYSFLATSDDIRDHVSVCWDFDGPGFVDKSLFETDAYLYNQNKIKAMSSTMSVVAMLLYNVDKIEFLRTSGFTVLQHDAFNWHISKDGTHLLRVKRNSITSRYFTKSVDRIFEITTPEFREEYMKVLYFIAMDNPKSSLLDIKNQPFEWIKTLKLRKKLLTSKQYATYKMMNSLIRKAFKDVFEENIFKKTKAKHRAKSIKKVRKEIANNA